MSYIVKHMRGGATLRSRSVPNWQMAALAASRMAGYSERRAKDYLAGNVAGWNARCPAGGDRAGRYDHVMPVKGTDQECVWIEDHRPT